MEGREKSSAALSAARAAIILSGVPEPSRPAALTSAEPGFSELLEAIAISESSTMTADLKKFLYGLMNSVEGLYSILITDRDGVPVVSVADEKEVPELATRASFLSTFGMATDQGSKLGLGKNKTIICMYSSYQVVQMNKLPLVISFIASHNCNTGHILSLENKIDPILSTLKNAVTEA